MDDLKFITYQGHKLDPSEEPWEPFRLQAFNKEQADQPMSTKRDQ